MNDSHGERIQPPSRIITMVSKYQALRMDTAVAHNTFPIVVTIRRGRHKFAARGPSCKVADMV